MLNLIGEGVTKGAKKALQETAEEVGEKATEKAAKKAVGSAADIAKFITNKYGDKADEIMAYYGGDIGKSARSAQNSFLGRLISGQKVENPLVMYHSVDSSKLRDILELADATYSDYAIPNPSVQVVDPTKNVGTSYGDVILLGNKSIPGGINKYSGKPDLYGGKYNLFSRDIYSPRKPNIEWSKGVPTIAGTMKRATPDNISEYMTKQGTKAVEGNWSTPASLAAATSKRFKSPLEAIKNSDLLQSQGGLQRAFNDWDKEVSDSVQTLLDRYMVDNPDVNQYSYADYIMSELQDAMAGKRGWDDPYGINTTEEGRNIVKNLTSKAKELPTAYFEGKPSRAIPLEEFGGVILPEGFSDTYVDKALKDAGIEIKGWYDPENYEESLQNTLVNLTKSSDRLSTPYLMSKEPSLVDMARNIKAMRASQNMADDGIRRIGSANVAPVNPDTLPSGWKELEKYLDNSADRLPRELGIPKSKITKGDLASYLDEVGYDSAGTKDEMWKNALMAIDDNTLDELYNTGGGTAADFLQNRLPFRHNPRLTDATNYYIGNKGRTGRLDAEYSDRLGIGRSNTPMSDDLVNPYSSAGGDYSEGAFGTSPTWANGETGVSTAAHERLHAWQDINKFDWDEGVVDAIDELRSELEKFYHDNDTLKKYHGGGKLEYYADPKEQEARMLQSYLDNEGYTNTYKRTSEKGTEWGNEIKPAFDKFFNKLRALSKAGVALPVGLALLLGENYNNKKKEG